MKRTLVCSAWSLCLASSLALCLTGRALAQGDYFELVRDAEREFKDGEHATSRDLFRRALAARPTSIALYGIAMTSQALSDHAEAVRMARAALTKQDGLLPDLQRQHLLDLIERARPLVAELVVESDPPNVQIAIDGEVIPVGPYNELVIRPGRRTVRALADGYMPYLTEINARAGTRETLTVELVQPNRPSALYEGVEQAESEEDDGPSLVVPIILVSVGGAALLAGGITGIVALDNEGDLEDRCGAMPQACPKSNTALAHSAEDLALATNVLWVVGGLTSAVGVTWLVLALTGDERETSASLDLGPDRAGLRLSGQF